MPRKRKTHEHKLCRPPAGSTDVERLTRDGRWIKDDGKPGLAFSYRRAPGVPAGGYPMAGAPSCDVGLYDDQCPHNMAIHRTASRWGAANGEDLEPVE